MVNRTANTEIPREQRRVIKSSGLQGQGCHSLQIPGTDGDQPTQRTTHQSKCIMAQPKYKTKPIYQMVIYADINCKLFASCLFQTTSSVCDFCFILCCSSLSNSSASLCWQNSFIHYEDLYSAPPGYHKGEHPIKAQNDPGFHVVGKCAGGGRGRKQNKKGKSRRCSNMSRKKGSRRRTRRTSTKRRMDKINIKLSPMCLLYWTIFH